MDNFSGSSLSGITDLPGVTLIYGISQTSHTSVAEMIELVREPARGWRVAFYVKTGTVLLFDPTPGAASSARSEPRVASDPAPVPGGVPGPPSSGPGTGGIGVGPGFHSTTKSAVDQRPVPLNAPQPRYTREARDNKVQGTVVARVLVGEDGLVKQVRIVRGLPDGLNDEATRVAFELRFKPAMKDGKPVEFWQAISIQFNLR